MQVKRCCVCLPVCELRRECCSTVDHRCRRRWQVGRRRWPTASACVPSRPWSCDAVGWRCIGVAGGCCLAVDGRRRRRRCCLDVVRQWRWGTTSRWLSRRSDDVLGSTASICIAHQTALPSRTCHFSLITFYLHLRDAEDTWLVSNKTFLQK